MINFKNWIKLSLVIALLSLACWGQVTADTGYTVPRSGFGLSLILGPGTCATAAGVTVSYLGTLINLTSNATNFGYLTSTCAVTVNTSGFPASSIPIFTAVTGVSAINTLTDSRTTYNFSAGGGASNIANGTASLGTGAIPSATCATAVTVSATGVATTDVITAVFNADPTATTGYIPSTSGMLTIIPYPTANNVNFKVCNNTASSITPGAITLNWKVVR